MSRERRAVAAELITKDPNVEPGFGFKYVLCHKTDPLGKKDKKAYKNAAEAEQALKQQANSADWEILGPISVALNQSNDWIDWQGRPHEQRIQITKDHVVITVGDKSVAFERSDKHLRFNYEIFYGPVPLTGP